MFWPPFVFLVRRAPALQLVQEFRRVFEFRQRRARFAPPLHGQSPDETEPPVVCDADGLQIGRGLNERVHGRRSRAKSRCCSINPDVGFGARGASK